MTLVVPSQTFEVDAAWRIADAKTLQELLDAGTAVLSQLRIDHAVIYSLAVDERWAYLPLIPLMPELDGAIAQCLRSKSHPGLGDAAEVFGDGTSETEAGAGRGGVVAPLQTRFGMAGLRQVYRLQVLTPGMQPALFEVARRGTSIDRTELQDLELVGQQLVDRLPACFWVVPGDGNGPQLVYRVT